jgi:hypothetical protein
VHQEPPVEVSSFNDAHLPETQDPEEDPEMKTAQEMERSDAAFAEAMMLAQMEQSTVSAFQPGSVEPGLDTLCDSRVARQLQW